MKKIESVSAYSKNVYDRFAAFILEASTVDSMIRRFKMFRKLAQNFRRGDTFIFESLAPTVSGSCLATYAHDLDKYYKCEFIYKVSDGGEILRNESGAIIGKSSCNVYRLEVNPNDLDDVLDDIKETIMKKFDL